jgi:hypothetical protein
MDFSKFADTSFPKEKPKTKGQLLKEDFRSFLNDKWYEHCDELMAWEKQYPEYDRDYYFKKHKWLLKKMYKDSKSIETYLEDNEKEISKLVKRGFKKGKKGNF